MENSSSKPYGHIIIIIIIIIRLYNLHNYSIETLHTNNLHTLTLFTLVLTEVEQETHRYDIVLTDGSSCLFIS